MSRLSMSRLMDKPPWSAKLSLQMQSDRRARMYRTLAVLIQNRVLLGEALAEMWGVYSNDGKKKSDPIALFLADAQRDVTEGRSMANALQRWMSPEEAALLSRAERTGDWQSALEDADRLVRAKSTIVGTVVGGVLYPIMIGITMIATLVVIATMLIPELNKAMPGRDWKGVTGALFWISDVVLHQGWIILAVGIALIVLVLLSLPRLTGNWRYRVERIPPWSIYRVVQGAPFMIAIGVMLRSGISLINALALLENNASAYMRERIVAIRRGIARGANLGQAMLDAEYDFPDREVIRFVRLLAGRDGFPDALLNYAESWMADTVKRVAVAMGVFGTVMLVISGLLIAMVIVGTIDIQSTMQGQMGH